MFLSLSEPGPPRINRDPRGTSAPPLEPAWLLGLWSLWWRIGVSAQGSPREGWIDLQPNEPRGRLGRPKEKGRGPVLFDYELDYAGALEAVLQNAFDQARDHGGSIEVELNAEGWFRVRDEGEGFPVHGHPFSKRPLIEVILMGPRRGPRNSLAQVSSSCLWLEAETLREGRRYRQRYEFAKPTGPLEDLGPAPGSGTVLRLCPATGAPPSFPALVDELRELGRELPRATKIEVRGLEDEVESLTLGG